MDASRPILFGRARQHPTVTPVNASTGTGVHLDHGNRRGRSGFAEHPGQRDDTPFGRFAGRIQAFTLHLTDDDRAALGALYLVAENRYGSDSSQMRKVDDLARKLSRQRQAELPPAPEEDAEEPAPVGTGPTTPEPDSEITHPPAIPAMAAAAGITTWQLLMQDDTSRESARLLEKQLGIRLVDRQA